MDIIKSIEHEQLKSKVPDIKVGDTVVVAFGRSVKENDQTIKPHTNTMRIETVY